MIIEDDGYLNLGMKSGEAVQTLRVDYFALHTQFLIAVAKAPPMTDTNAAMVPVLEAVGFAGVSVKWACDVYDAITKLIESAKKKDSSSTGVEPPSSTDSPNPA